MELETDYEDEITDEDLKKIEEEIMGFAGPLPLPTPPPSEERMQSILEQAKLEAVAKDSADFIADGVGWFIGTPLLPIDTVESASHVN